jgi:thymidylate synthase (FAD)
MHPVQPPFRENEGREVPLPCQGEVHAPAFPAQHHTAGRDPCLGGGLPPVRRALPHPPEVLIIARSGVDFDAMVDYLVAVGGESWLERVAPLLVPEGTVSEGEALVEFAGRLCYRSWEPGLNPNVRQVRTDVHAYLDNILKSLHGSVLEHSFYVFVFHHVSRVFTHELVRHRIGTSISQESLRFVRLDDLPFWFPDWAQADEELMQRSMGLLAEMEKHQRWMAEHFALDAPGKTFEEKKFRTSFMRRFAPEGVATGLVWGANLRTIRHVLQMRTDPGAEEEMRLVFGTVGDIIAHECPFLFDDFQADEGVWVPRYRKV